MGAPGDNRGGGRPGDPFGREALAFSREKLMQRNVELRVTDMDKNGVALGFLFCGTGSQRRNFAADILEVRPCLSSCRVLRRRVLFRSLAWLRRSLLVN